jgi:hypothetical protein
MPREREMTDTPPLVILEETEMAFLVRVRLGTRSEPDLRDQWLPKSLVVSDHVRGVHCVIAIARWFVAKNGLEFVLNSW